MFESVKPEFLILVIHTVILWMLVFFLHRFRSRLTLIPLYGLLAALVVYTHVLSTFETSVVQWGFYFLVSSTAYFTPLLLIILIVYLFDGVRAARKGLEIVIGISLLQAFVVYISNVEDATHMFIPANPANFINYFWSAVAMVIDIALMGVVWEILGKSSRLPLTLKVILLIFIVFVFDTFIFVTGVFGASANYLSIIVSDLVVRLILSVIMGIVIADYLESSAFSEEKRIKPKKIWEIVNFRSALEEEVSSLQAEVEKRKISETELRASRELYKLALEGTSAGIWDWSADQKVDEWSAGFFSLLGYEKNELVPSYEGFISMVHPDDVGKINEILNIDFANENQFMTECRIRTKSGKYKWFLLSGKRKNVDGKPVRMVVSIIDIQDKKDTQIELSRKLSEVENANKIMIDRELKMTELKKEIESLKKYTHTDE